MGYTVYWYQNRAYTPVEWTAIMDVALKAIGAAQLKKIRVCYEHDKANCPPEISREVIHFNGAGEKGHETFQLVRDPENPKWGLRKHDSPDWFSFCKTQRKPYGDVVVTILEEAEKAVPGVLRISMDGPCHTNLITGKEVEDPHEPA